MAVLEASWPSWRCLEAILSKQADETVTPSRWTETPEGVSKRTHNHQTFSTPGTPVIHQRGAAEITERARHE
eukprot:7196139-Pyramimonas_sp.AAC.1